MSDEQAGPLDAILNEWSADAQIDKGKLDDFSVKIPHLHAKYLRMYEDARLIKEKLKVELAQAQEDRRAWILGEMTDAESKRRGWGAWQLARPLRSQAEAIALKQPECVRLSVRLSIADQRVDCLDKIIRAINNLSFSVKNAIDFMRFQAGLN